MERVEPLLCSVEIGTSQKQCIYHTYHILYSNIFQMEVEKTQFDTQLEDLLEKEKISRSINDHLQTSSLLKQIATLCYQTQHFDQLNEMITTLMKKRGQAKKAQIDLVQLAMTWLPSITDEAVKTKLIETLRDVTDKKIFLEVEYARLVLMIVKGKEDDNDINEAAKILQEVQVETYGSMDRREKLEFILYQMKIMIKRKDYIRLFVISKKINENNINDDNLADLKVLYYAYVAIYYNHFSKFYDASQCYKTIWEVMNSTKKDIPDVLDFGFKGGKINSLSNYVGFLVLHPASERSKKQLEALRANKEVEKISHIKQVVDAFLSKQIVNSSISHYDIQKYQLFSNEYQNHQIHTSTFRKMLLQHNIKTMSNYYTQVTLKRVAELIGGTQQESEDQLCGLMDEKLVNCKIDRLDGVIDFEVVQNENSRLDVWNTSVNGVLDLVDKASKLIRRENEMANLG